MTLKDLNICSPGYLQAQNDSFSLKEKKKVAVYHHTGSAGKIYGIYSTCWSVFLTQIFAPLIDSFYFQAFVVEFMGTYKHALLGSH